jgi:hypothetical protein
LQFRARDAYRMDDGRTVRQRFRGNTGCIGRGRYGVGHKGSQCLCADQLPPLVHGYAHDLTLSWTKAGRSPNSISLSSFSSLPSVAKKQLSDSECSRLLLNQKLWPCIVDRWSTCNPCFLRRPAASTIHSPEPDRHEMATCIKRQSQAPSRTGSKISSGDRIARNRTIVFWPSYSFLCITHQSFWCARKGDLMRKPNIPRPGITSLRHRIAGISRLDLHREFLNRENDGRALHPRE